jgi:hypothetical protein
MKKHLITTNLASIPEVVRGEVSFVHPQSAERIMEAVVCKETVEKIPEKIFDREESGEKLHLLYQAL